MGDTARGIHPAGGADSVVISLEFLVFIMLFRVLVLVDSLFCLYCDLVLY